MKQKGHFVLSAASVGRAHTVLASIAFVTALVVGCYCHYFKIVKNGVATYPDEWFPSVSATIGDWYPERNLFQILIALTSGPRFALVFIQYYLHCSAGSLSTILFIIGIIRTLSCGGWVYITSNDDHDIHDIMMITYMVCNIPWMVGGILSTPTSTVRRKRFFASLIPLVYFFIQHKVHRIPGARFTDHITDYRQPFSFLVDCYLSYIFWSIFTSLIPTLFYFSVWKLGIAGNELALLSLLSPVLLNFPSILNLVSSHTGQVSLNFFSLIGLVAYKSADPLNRLVLVAIANIVLMLKQVAQWSAISRDSKDASYQAILASLGFLLSSLSKHANHSNNPVWPFIDGKNGGCNKAGLTLAILALVEYATRRSPSSFSINAPLVTPQKPRHWLTASLSLGSLLFSLHNFLADPTTLIAISWTGYENRLPRGPLPHIHGSITLVVMCLGVLLSALSESLGAASESPASPFITPLSHPIWFVFGSASAYIMYTFRDWLGYAGGLGFGFFLMSIIPVVFQGAAAAAVTSVKGKGGVVKIVTHLARTYTVALLVYCLFNLASIFTVAYAFVPGGLYFRERTDLVTVAQLACLALAFRFPALNPLPSRSAIAISSFTQSYTKTLLACISVTSVLVTMYRLPASPPHPFNPGPRIINAGIWTVHFGIDNEGHDSQRGIRNLIRDMKLDIVGLLETDLHRTAFGHRDLQNVDIGPGPNSHTWGAVLLSKFPIINTTHHLLPSPKGELAPAIEAVLDVFGTPVTVVVAHNGQEEDALDRELQSTELARIMAATPNPVIFLGYVVTTPHSKRPNPYEIMVTDGNVHDIDEDDLDRWCEYIFYRGLYRTSYARISRGTITDTETQIGQFVLPRHGEAITNDTHEARYLRSRKEDLAVNHWFPMEYYGDETKGGVNGHFYHVFNTPLYYKIPQAAT
ncbi:hypothetical protein K443DRAFT_127052 [Laccaria amethystina LaAM-08-1]|uniref:Calcofluor white hypersensitive protein n=1 Tax=Laccaria amethystina LaAM-08-1 TaxID=1095629 RepID=A0A0C9XZC8_9AGAR|nr:hypothetical protein K443DRAFT_127052 [Laccaria amethystina LaAM-08-1]